MKHTFKHFYACKTVQNLVSLGGDYTMKPKRKTKNHDAGSDLVFTANKVIMTKLGIEVKNFLILKWHHKELQLATRGKSFLCL